MLPTSFSLARRHSQVVRACVLAGAAFSACAIFTPAAAQSAQGIEKVQGASDERAQLKRGGAASAASNSSSRSTRSIHATPELAKHGEQGLTKALKGSVNCASHLHNGGRAGADGADQKAADAPLNANALIDEALRGKKIEYAEGASLAGLDAMLMNHYGMPTSIRTAIKDPESFETIGRIALLIQNNYVVASQMALGAAISAGSIQSPTVNYLHRFISYATDPYHGNAELEDAMAAVNKGFATAQSISPQPRAFARWVVRATVYRDAVAFDAAMAGFCASKPIAQDLRLLNAALKPARDYSKNTYPDPALTSGSEPAPNPLNGGR